jgi:hypothetical protein
MFNQGPGSRKYFCKKSLFMLRVIAYGKERILVGADRGGLEGASGGLADRRTAGGQDHAGEGPAGCRLFRLRTATGAPDHRRGPGGVSGAERLPAGRAGRSSSGGQSIGTAQDCGRSSSRNTCSGHGIVHAGGEQAVPGYVGRAEASTASLPGAVHRAGGFRSYGSRTAIAARRAAGKPAGGRVSGEGFCRVDGRLLG